MYINSRFFLIQLILTFIVILHSVGQTTVFFQGFENASTSCAENWGYTGGIATTELAKTGTRSARVGRSGESSTLLFNSINISSLTGLQLQIHHSVKGGTGPGMDTREGASIQVSLNGGAWINIGQVGGFGDVNWGWNVTGGSASASGGCTVYQSANPINYSVPLGTSIIALRVVSVTAGNCTTFNTNMNNGTASLFDRTDEGIYIDDVKLTTTGDIPGIWKGTVSNDWFDCKNWYYSKVPTATTDVTIDQTAVNPCVIDAAGSAVCRNINISSNNTVSSSLTIQNASSLISGGNTVITKTAGSGICKLELLGSNCSFTCNSVTLNGTSSGAGNAQFLNEFHLNTATINGSFIINPGGRLDLNSPSDYGIINLKGNYINNGLESDFVHTNSIVIINGTGSQSISTNSFTEVFSTLRINKTSGSLILSSNVNIESTLELQNGLLDLNSRTLSIVNSLPSGIQRTGGGILSEKSNNSSKILWQINSALGIYIFPFSKNDTTYIPITFEHTSGNAGNVTASTYGTSSSNLPWPITPVAVTYFNNSSGQNDSAATVDRFWHIDVSGSAIANLTLTYSPTELPLPPFNNPLNTKAQNYSSGIWNSYAPLQSAGPYFVSIPAISDFSTFAITNISSPLPIELLGFEAFLKEGIVITKWATASETNNDKFIVERSDDGEEFSKIGELDGAGNSYSTLFYNFHDYFPLDGISFYRLKQIDYDGNFSYSKIVVVKKQSQTEFQIFPNPAAEYFILSVKERELNKVSIISIDGKIVYNSIYENQNDFIKIDISTFAPGIYLLQIENENGINQSKFSKQ